MNATPATFPYPDMPTILDSDIDIPKTDAEMTYPEKKKINEAIRQNMRNKNVYKSDTHTIYNIIVRQTNEKLQEKVALDATF